MKSDPKSIALIGGTFDPIHNGHLAIATQLLSKIPFDEVQFIPNKQPRGKNPNSTPAQRLDMLQLALAPYPQFKINTCEFNRAGKTYSIDTLKLLRARHPKAAISLIIGADVFQHFNQWLHWFQLLDYCHLIIVSRSDYQLTETTWMKKLLAEHETMQKDMLMHHTAGAVYRLNLPLPSISSSMIRDAIQQGKLNDSSELLPANVFSYIQQHELYQA